MGRFSKTFAAAVTLVAISAVPALAEDYTYAEDFSFSGTIRSDNYTFTTDDENPTVTVTTAADLFLYSTVTFSPSDSSHTLNWTASSNLYLYCENLTIANGTVVTSNKIYTGMGALVNLTSGSSWTISGDSIIGSSDASIFNATVFNVTGTGTTLTTTAKVQIGSGSTFNLSDGATWTSSGSAYVYIYNKMNITGEGTYWNAGNTILVGYSTPSAVYYTGTLTISDGAKCEFGGAVYVCKNSSMEVSGGATLETSGEFYAYGEVTISGTGTTWSSSGTVYVGSSTYTTATLTISNGAALTICSGTATISSTLSNAGTIYLKEGGQLLIETSAATSAGTIVISLNSAYLFATAEITDQKTLEIGKKTDKGGITAMTTSSEASCSASVSLSAVATDEAIVKELAALGYYEYALAYSGWNLKIDIEAFSVSLGEALESVNGALYAIVEYSAETGILSIWVVPEPSLFGVFAGLSALTLAGTRRRRKKLLR